MDLTITKHKILTGQSFLSLLNLGIVLLDGPDSTDFLQRIATADFSSFKQGTAHSIKTCFVNSKGQVVDHSLVIKQAPSSYLLISSFPSPATLLNWLDSFHFIENLSLTPSSQSATVSIEHSQNSFEPEQYLWWRSPLKTEANIDFRVNLRPTKPYPLLTSEEIESLRIAALMPGLTELSLGLMPQNIGLSSLVASNKGCYIGQEVLAKAQTYQKNPKMMAGLTLSPAQLKANLHFINSHSWNGTISSISPILSPYLVNSLAIVNRPLATAPINGHLLNDSQFIFT